MQELWERHEKYMRETAMKKLTATKNVGEDISAPVNGAEIPLQPGSKIMVKQGKSMRTKEEQEGTTVDRS